MLKLNIGRPTCLTFYELKEKVKRVMDIKGVRIIERRGHEDI